MELQPLEPFAGVKLWLTTTQYEPLKQTLSLVAWQIILRGFNYDVRLNFDALKHCHFVSNNHGEIRPSEAIFRLPSDPNSFIRPCSISPDRKAFCRFF